MKYLQKVQNLPTNLKEGVLYYSVEDNEITIKKTEPTPVDPVEFVDLGLPSGLLWAKCNVGAQNEWEGGYFFQWGEIEGHDLNATGGTTEKQYNWSTAPFNNGSSDYDENYFASVSGEVITTKEGEFPPILKSQYDAATKAYGEGYRMPTRGEMEELTANTTSTWYAKGNTEFNGVSGRLFTSKVNDNSIFIPAAGYGSNDSLLNVGSFGYVWTSSLVGYPYSAWNVYFIGNGVYMTSYDRWCGFSVRAVKPNA